MRVLRKRERAALEAVARRFSAAWVEGEDSSDALLRAAGKRIAVDITSFRGSGALRGGEAGPRLRCDRVVTRLTERLQGALGKTIPDGKTVFVTITAPIRLPSKTAASLEEEVRTLLERRSPGRDVKLTLHRNRIRVRLLKSGTERAPAMLVLVHHPDSDPLLLLDAAEDLFGLIRAQAGRRAPKFAGDRWLVVISARESSCLEAYRSISSQLHMPTGFTKILVVFHDGRVGVLTE